jgi:hypothetical protein
MVLNAMDIALDAQAEQATAKASGIDDERNEAINESVKRVGNETVSLIGKFHRVRPSGGGEIDTPFLTTVHPESQGNAMLEKAPGHGIDNAIGSTYVSGRVAKNEIDTERVFKVSRSGLAMMSWNKNETLRVDGLALTVPIAAGVTTYLKAEAWVACAGQSSSTGLELVIVIGEDNQRQGEASDRLADSCAISKPVDVGNSTQWHEPTLKHGRLMIGTDADETVGVPVFVRVRSYSSGSGSTPVQTPAKFRINDTYRVNSNSVNVRSAPNTGASINAVLNTGAAGTIVGGPAYGSDLKWWQIAGAASGWVAEQYLTNTTPAAAPAESTNRIRSAWLEVTRIPK